MASRPTFRVRSKTTMSPCIFSDANLNERERQLLANPPITLHLPIDRLLKPSSKQTEIRQVPNQFLLYRRNFSASVKGQKKPLKEISAEATKRWYAEPDNVKIYFYSLSRIMKKIYITRKQPSKCNLKFTEYTSYSIFY